MWASVTDLDDHVVLLDERDTPLGTHPRATVHTVDTPRHLAFSCYLFNAAGQVLLTRRALSKSTWPGVWTNSCCGHPRVQETFEHAIARRLDHELGVRAQDLRCVLPDFGYTARDVSGVLENEFCPVFTAQLVHPDRDVVPNPSEVSDWRWAAWEDVVSATQAAPFVFSPWAVQQIGLLQTSSLTPTGGATWRRE